MWKGRIPLISLCVILSVISVFLPRDLARIHNYVFTSVVPLVTSVLSFIIYVHSTGSLRRIALAVALLTLFSWLGEITWNYYELIGEKPTPSLADLFWLSSYFPLFYVLIKILAENLRYVKLKGFVLAAVVASLSITFVLFPSIQISSRLPRLEAIVNVSYIALTVALLPVLILLYYVVYLRRAYLYVAIVLSVTFAFLGNVLYNYYDSMGIYYTGSLPDAFYNLSYMTLLLTMYEVYKREVEIVTAEDLERERCKVRLLNRLIRHDIMNDLSVVLGYLELYKEKGDIRFLEKAEARIRSSINLIKSATEEGRLRPVNIREVVIREAEGVDADVKVKMPDTYVLADDLIHSVVRNILVNSVLHCDVRPEIEVEAERKDGWVEVRFKDNGPGIPDDMKERIFEEGFGRGTGLGLYLVKSIVEGYGGKVWVEDNKPKGSVFVLRLRGHTC